MKCKCGTIMLYAGSKIFVCMKCKTVNEKGKVLKKVMNPLKEFMFGGHHYKANRFMKNNGGK